MVVLMGTSRRPMRGVSGTLITGGFTCWKTWPSRGVGAARPEPVLGGCSGTISTLVSAGFSAVAFFFAGSCTRGVEASALVSSTTLPPAMSALGVGVTSGEAELAGATAVLLFLLFW